MMSTETDVKEAVIKLEAKMEVMSDSMVSMARSIEKLADLRFDLVAIKKDVVMLQNTSDKIDASLSALEKRQTELEKIQAKNTYVIGKIEIFWSAIIAGAAGFLWWLLRT